MTPLGHVITYDWSCHGAVWMHGTNRISQVSLLEYEGIKEADLVIALLPGGRGTHAEIGIALGLGIPVMIYSPNRNPFH